MLILLIIMFSVTLYVTVVGLRNNFDASSVVLHEVSEYVSTEMMNALSLAQLSGSEEMFFYKVIFIPEAINNQGYTIELVNDTETSRWKVIAYLTQYPWVKGESELHFPFSNSTEVSCEDKTGSFDNYKIHYGPKLYSGVGHAGGSKMVVWCNVYIEDGIKKVRVGIGVLESG
jgi:hypothetical protein